MTAQTQWPVGPLLKGIRDNQRLQNITETYDKGHLQRLKLYEYDREFHVITKVYCHKAHERGCRECTTCHFCRQKTIDEKTTCNRCGGGYWCGNCLFNRMGENIDEVLPLCDENKWTCPVCRKLCNCSSVNCIRTSRGWDPTGQLTAEAKNYGYKSVAHYLVLTALDETVRESRMDDVVWSVPRAPRPSKPRQHAGAVQPAHSTQHCAQHTSRISQAQQECSRLLQASRQELKLDMLRQQVVQECGMGLAVLEDDDDVQDESSSVQQPDRRKQAGSAGVSPAGGVSGLQVPAPLFSGAGGAATGAGRDRQQPQPRSSNLRPHQTGPPAAAGGTSAAGGADLQHGLPSPAAAAATAAAAAAAAGSSGAVVSSGLLGLQVPEEELGVLGDRGCSPLLQPAAAGDSPTAHRGPAEQQAGSGPRVDAAAAAAGGGGWQGGTMQHRAPSGGPAAVGACQQRPLQTPLQQRQQPPHQQQQQALPQQEQQQQHVVPLVPDFGADDLPGAGAPGWRDGSDHAQQSGTRRRRRFAAVGRLFGRPRAQARAGRVHLAVNVDAAPAQLLSPRSTAGRVVPAGAATGAAAAAAATTGAGAGAGPGAVAVTGYDLDGDDVMCMGNSSMHDPTAAAAAAAAGQSIALDEAAEPSPKRVRLSDAAGAAGSSHPASQPTALDSSEFDDISEASPLDRAELQQLELVLKLASDAERLPYDQLRRDLEQIMETAFEGWTGHKSAGSFLVDGNFGGDKDTCSLEQLQRSCRVLELLAQYAPCDVDTDFGCEDITRRLSSQDFFVDFKNSGLDARTELIKSAENLVKVFSSRCQAADAVETTLAAMNCPTPDYSYAASDALSKLAVVAAQVAQKGLSDTVGCLLHWMAVLHKEAQQVQQLKLQSRQKLPFASGPDLLAARKWGPFRWGSRREAVQPDWQGLNQAQTAEKQTESRALREMHLDLVCQVDTNHLAGIAMFLGTQGLPSTVAVQVLRSQVLVDLLSHDVPFSDDVRTTVEVQSAVLTLVAKLLKQAMPDVQPEDAWPLDLRNTQQLWARLGDLPANDEQLMDQAETLFRRAQAEQVQAAGQRALAELASSVVQQLLDPAERLVAAQYQIRKHSRAVSPDWEPTERQKQQSIAVGSIKVDVLAALYALQLQAGARWEQLRALVAQPAPDFSTVFLGLPHLQRFRLYLVSQIVSSAPAFVGWVSWGHLPPNSIPAKELMWLWVRCVLYPHSPKLFGTCVEHFTRVLLQAPATRPLFEMLSADLQQQGKVQAILQEDCGFQHGGKQRALLLRQVLQQVQRCWNNLGLGAILRDVQRDLQKWQSSGQRWKHSCTLSLLQLCELCMQFPVNDAAGIVNGLLEVATRWMQDGIEAVCRQGGQQAPSSDNPETSGDMQGLVRVEETALRHLSPYLGFIVRLAGHAKRLERTSTAAWPACAIHSSSNSSAKLSDAVAEAVPKAGNHACLATESLFCLRDLLSTALVCMSGSDEPTAQDTALLQHLAGELALKSGLGSAAQRPGYSSPGLLHHVLSIHLHTAIKDAATGVPLAVHKGVNAVQLISKLCDQLLVAAAPGPAACAQQLLLPCLAYPLLEVAKADMSVPGCCRVQLQVFLLLKQLLGLVPLLPPTELDAQAVGKAADVTQGPLRQMAPISQPQLQHVFHQLMNLSLHSCLRIASAAFGGPEQGAAAQAAYEAAANAVQGVLGLPCGVPDLAKQYPKPPAGIAITDTPAMAQFQAFEAGLKFAAQLAQHADVGQQAVKQILMPGIHKLLMQRHVPQESVGKVAQLYNVLVQGLPADEQSSWKVPDHLLMPPPALPQQQQHRQGGQARQLQQQQQQQPQGWRHAAGVANIPSAPAASECGSQACSAVGRPTQRTWGMAQVQTVFEPDPSHMPYSQDGGRVASCAGPAPSALQGPAASAAAGAAKRKQPGSPGAAGLDGDADGEVSSSGQSQHKKQRGDEAASAHQQEELPDVFSQDQGPGQGEVTQPQPHAQQPQQQRRQQPPHQQGQPASPQQEATQQQQQQQQQQQEEDELRRNPHGQCQQSNGGAGAAHAASQSGKFHVAGYWMAVTKDKQALTQQGQEQWKLWLAKVPITPQTPVGANLRAWVICNWNAEFVQTVKGMVALGLLQQGREIRGTKAVVTSVSKMDDPNSLAACDRSKLLLDPDAAKGKGLEYTEADCKVWARCWELMSAGPRSSGSDPCVLVAETQSHPSTQRQQLLKQTEQQQRFSPERQQQQQGCQQQEVQQQDHTQQQQQQEVRQLQPEQQQQAQQQQQSTAQGAAAAQAGGQAASWLQGDHPSAIQDSQATIRYPTAPFQ